jgi:hypothetical protein
MAQITMTETNNWSESDIKAEVNENGLIKIWFEYKQSRGIAGQRRHEMLFTAIEWDTLVERVEWQRKEKKINKSES